MDYYKTATRLIKNYGAIPSCLPLISGRALPPLFLFLELTYQCNLRCPYCDSKTVVAVAILCGAILWESS
jgi:hypothetical protein